MNKSLTLEFRDENGEHDVRPIVEGEISLGHLASAAALVFYMVHCKCGPEEVDKFTDAVKMQFLGWVDEDRVLN
jgi:hypothetical protein